MSEREITVKNHTVAMRVTLQEKVLIMEKAEVLGIKVADYIAMKVFSEKKSESKPLEGVPKSEFEEVSAKLSKSTKEATKLRSETTKLKSEITKLQKALDKEKQTSSTYKMAAKELAKK